MIIQRYTKNDMLLHHIKSDFVDTTKIAFLCILQKVNK